MEIKLITGATTFEAAVNTIKQIDVTDIQQQNIVVVPDSFSLQAENLIFKVLKLKSTFNIEIVGISRLASKLLRSNNIGFDRISALEEIFNIYKAVKGCEVKFQYFKTCGVEFCVTILQVIKQFKACKIAPDKMKVTKNDDLLAKKMHDLRMIYEAYDALLGEKLDLSKLLKFFVEKADTRLDLSKTNLFFVNFDSFSMEINSFICNLAKSVGKIYIGMARPISPKNAFIYENDIFKKTTALAKEYSVPVKVESFATEISGEKLKIVENLFAFDVECGKSDKFLNILAKNKQDEVEYAAKYIKYQVFNGKRFKDFSIAVSDEKYFDLIKQTFADFGIAVYCDDAVNLSQTILGRFVFKMLEIAKLGFGREAFEYLASSPLFGEDEKLLGQIFYYQIEDEKEFLKIAPQFEKIVLQIKMLNSCKKAHEFESVLRQLLIFVDEKYQNFLFKMEDERFFKKQSENAQAKELIEQVFKKLSELGGEDEFLLLDFENLLKLAFRSVKVETIPTYIDAVYVGDATTSYFEDVDTLFVLGATARALPRQQGDTGIIDDEEIKKLKLDFALEPEIRVLNRRNRLKLFELLQHWTTKLIVCQPISEDGRPLPRADFVNDLISLFGKNVVHTTAYEDFNLAGHSKDEEFERLLFCLGNRMNLLNVYSKLREDLPREFAAEVGQIAGKSKKEQNLSDATVKQEVLTISASALESYFACPFKFFMQYGLKVKQKETAEPDKRKFGIFQHALLKGFVSKFENLRAVDEKQIETYLKENVSKLAEEIYDKEVLKKGYLLKFLQNESKIILKNVIKEQKCSDFRPVLLEQKIFEPLGNDVNLIGFVDRVDACKKYFRIIDYKTGKTDNLKKELFYGKKLQLFLYANAVKNKTGLDCAGVYYFDCQTKYLKLNKHKNLFNGLTLKNNEIVEMTDFRVFDEGVKSDIIGVSRKKNVKGGEFSFKNGNLTENFASDFDYAKRISLQAVSEIRDGYIAPKPFAGECAFCPYISVCKHGENDGERKVLKEKVEKKEE
ncbi:MAG: PD-(D/E)XK nuclease family protein [Clostridia bacterium]|nr:PD-(D/E)XK nuclease family protein [Clostridia bacterium]